MWSLLDETARLPDLLRGWPPSPEASQPLSFQDTAGACITSQTMPHWHVTVGLRGGFYLLAASLASLPTHHYVEEQSVISLAVQVFQICAGLCSVEVVNFSERRRKGPHGSDRRQDCKPWAIGGAGRNEGPQHIPLFVQWGFIEHMLCAWPWSRKRLEMCLRGPSWATSLLCTPCKPCGLSGPNLHEQS